MRQLRLIRACSWGAAILPQQVLGLTAATGYGEI